MKNEESDSYVFGGTDEIYSSSNRMIQWVGNRLTDAVRLLMARINARTLFGLNVGCGDGQRLARLAQSGVSRLMVAVEIDPARIGFAKRRYPLCEYVRADIFHLPLKSQIFDYIVATQILEHLTDPASALREIVRVAKPHAWIILSVPHEPFFRWGIFVRGKYRHHGGRDPSHVQFWSRAEFRCVIREFVEIREEQWISTFPWLLYLGRLK